MAKQSVLVAKHQLSYRAEGKREIVAPGTELTAALLKKMKLGKEDVDDLKAKGAVTETDMRVSDAGGGEEIAALQEQLGKAEAAAAAEKKRADDAEARAAAAEAELAAVQAPVEGKGASKAGA